MAKFFDVEPFVWSKATRGPFPYLWAKCDPSQAEDPVVHDVVEGEDGFEHRVIWRDNTGVKLTATTEQIHRNTLAKMYRHAREVAEEIEFYGSGPFSH